MKFICSGKVYDTENSEIITAFERHWDIKVRANSYDHVNLSTTIYKTKKRAFYVVAQYNHKAVFDIMSKDEVKNILEENNNVVWYEKLFGKLEEA